jgi:hypothetical protein
MECGEFYYFSTKFKTNQARKKSLTNLKHLCQFEDPRAVLLQLSQLLLGSADEELGVVDVHAANVDDGVVSIVANLVLSARDSAIALFAAACVLAFLAAWATVRGVFPLSPFVRREQANWPSGRIVIATS